MIIKFNNAFLQANNQVGIQFDVIQGKKTSLISVWRDKKGIQTSEGISAEVKAGVITQYLIRYKGFKK